MQNLLTLKQPLIMGILNVTPDSFFDGGQFNVLEHAHAKALQMIAQGADMIDIGGESTRPGAQLVSVQQEIDRVIPLIEQLKSINCPISIDTRKPQVMKLAIAAGASMINDVNALSSDEALEVVANAQVAVCLMHMQGEPQHMQHQPHYENVVDEVMSFLLERAARAEAAGILSSNIILDPGFGFGKTLDHNIQLFKSLNLLVNKGYPVLIGISRKSMLGEITAKDANQRMAASITSALLAAQAGVSILRVHDVSETKDMLNTLKSLGR